MTGGQPLIERSPFGFYYQTMPAVATDNGRRANGHGKRLARSDRRGRASMVRSKKLSGADGVPLVWERSLERIPTAFGKLVFVAELLDELTGKYWHRGLAFLMDDDAVDGLIRRSNRTLFGEWFRMDAASQTDDLAAYFLQRDRSETDARGVLDACDAHSPGPFRCFGPGSGIAAEI